MHRTPNSDSCAIGAGSPASRHEGKSLVIALGQIYRGRGWLADLAARARARLSRKGFKKREEVDPAWLPVQARLASEEYLGR